ncbi:acyl carrier protein [Hymenobacter sp. BT186]|jgi:acyl carrier protein|uniref:Acyl carrier protein n=1 Tax=Hymenobacter telluris TaxID=2816474 RepID=A0A939JCC6_9BACT|nr:phosphopantetheine-binding protein [Hymenobacter telluris]MBO0358225.1 acyl carrier protein [Hymenobacter telluris]MBW3374251.1 acyl carrier protein [Hymenobacter norwichensis]
MVSSTTTLAPKSIQQQVLRIISKRKSIKPQRLRIGSDLSRELGFDTVDVVDIILELERNFHITIPDEVPLATVGDFVSYVASHAHAA